MVVSAAELARALEQSRATAPPDEEHAPDLTVRHPAVVPPPPSDSDGATEGVPGTEGGDEAEPGEEVEKASPVRIAIALLVIVVLAALIVLLVLNALPR